MNSQRLLQWITGFTLVAFLSSACVAPQASTVPTGAASPGAGTGPAQFTDPFAYCTAVGTIDAPDERYAGPEVSEEIVQGLKAALEMADDAPTEWVVAGTVWRCMGGQVWACFVGANLPCTAKADTSRTPTSAMEDFCQENPGSDVIPAAVTGRATVYQWGCTNGTAEIVKELFKPDPQGFLSDFWYEITPE